MCGSFRWKDVFTLAAKFRAITSARAGAGDSIIFCATPVLLGDLVNL